jgi:diguanylate cyclase
MTDAQSTPKQWRLKTLLTVPFVALILMPALVIALSSLYTGLKAVDSLSSRVITDVSSRAELAAIHQLEEATVMLRSTVPDPENSLGSSEFLFRDSTLLEKKLFEMSAATRTTGYFFYGATDGTFIGVDRGRPGAKAAATVRLRGPEKLPRRIYSARAPGDRSRLLEVESRIYDARERPWFVQALKANQLTWTPIYVSFATGALVTTVSQPVVSAGGTTMGVLAADVELSELSAFMKTMSVSETGVAFIVDSEGYLVASSSPGTPFITKDGVQKRIRLSEANNEVESAAARWWSREGKHVGSSDATPRALDDARRVRNAKIETASGAAIDVASQRIRGVEGVEWDVVVAIPRSDLTAPIVRSAALMFAVILVALIAALQLGLWLVSRISRDVEGLAKAADNYGRVSEEFVLPETRLRETSLLSTAFASMFTRLKESLTTIRVQNEDLAALNATLEGRVVSRTRQLESKNFELSAEVNRRERLEADLRAASEEATQQADNKVRFMAMLGHELRTPLQAVIASSELLRRGEGEPTAHTETMSAASQSLLTLVDGVLTYAKLEAGRVDPALSVFDLRSTLDDAVRVAQSARQQSRARVLIEIASNLPQTLETDRGILRQIVINLVSNSLRHAPDGTIHVRVLKGPAAKTIANATGGSETEAREGVAQPFALCVTVADDGPGIPEALRGKLFQPFQQLGRSTADPSQGSGLGLAICALLARALDGDIMLVDDGVPGTRIDFSVSAFTSTGMASLATGTTTSEAIRAQSLLPINILLVEDHGVNLRLLSELLAIDRHRVAAAQSGESAIELVAQSLHQADPAAGNAAQAASPVWVGDCDLVLMDLNLPGRSGTETVTELRAMYARAHRREPIYVALSASTLEEVRDECAAVGMSRFLSKPATLEQLRALISEIASDRLPAGVSAADATSRDATPVLDESALSRLRAVEKNSSEPFVNKLIDEFLSVLESDVNRLVASIESGDQSKIRKSAHSLAGSALTVGARRLASMCQSASISAEFLRTVANDTRIALIEWQRRQN